MLGNMESKNESSIRTFELSEKVTVKKVSYKNRYGITVVADMYLSKDIDKSKKIPRNCHRNALWWCKRARCWYQRAQTLVQLGEQQWTYFENGTPEVPMGFPSESADSIPEGLDPISSEFFEYYGMERGHHPNAGAAFTITSSMSFMNFPLMNYIDTISPRPILFIIGENAHSRYYSEDAYEMAAELKELYVVPEARHIDLDDRIDMIPFDKLESFFAKYLGKK
jgi:fermentation-respiration switch protein FrsA (DUF1100 family)